MVDVPSFGQSDSKSVESVSERAKGLIPWLPDPYKCDDCNSTCEAAVTFDPTLCEPVKCWTCSNCGSTFYREGY